MAGGLRRRQLEAALYVNVLSPDRSQRAATRPAAVVVLGMHRSGTSSVAGALVRLGGSAPRHLMAACPDNARGFWESPVLMALNDDILAAGGSVWTDWRRFGAGRINAAQASTLRSRAKAVLVDEFGNSPVPIVKDPRMCRLMRFWLPVFEQLAWSPRVVLPVRSPLEVAWSLRRRDGSDVGASCLLWLRHVLDAEADTRGMKRAVLDWSRVLQDWPASLGPVAERLDVSLARDGDPGFAEVGEFLSSDLRQFTASPAQLHADPAVTKLVVEVYAAMLDLTDDAHHVSTLRRLDALRLRFEDAAAVFGPAMDERKRAAQAQHRAIGALEDAVRAQDAETADLRRAREDLERRNLELEHRIHEQERDHAEALARANAFINRCALGGPSKPEKRRRSTRSLRPPRTVNRQQLSTVRHSLFFDETFYLSVNPEVRASRCDAALHYLLHGWLEGRDPGPFFSTNAYLDRNPDVAAAGVNPLVHYETHGKKEDRPAIG